LLDVDSIMIRNELLINSFHVLETLFGLRQHALNCCRNPLETPQNTCHFVYYKLFLKNGWGIDCINCIGPIFNL
jgi:hypothetical protein